MKRYLTIYMMFFTFIACGQRTLLNIDAEDINVTTKVPKGWLYSFTPKQREAYTVKIDTLIKHSGKHSISIEKVNNVSPFGVIVYTVPAIYMGNTIELKGYIKIEQADSGFVGLWMRIDGKDKSIVFDNMEKKKLTGTADWKQYTITLAYDNKAAKSIVIGGLLSGKGKAWFDGFELFIDGKPIHEVTLKPLAKATLDTVYNTSSGIEPFKINEQIVNNLTIAGQFWAFLKYHHPAIAKGDYNWDAELFRFLPQVIDAKGNVQLSEALENYLEKLDIPVTSKHTIEFEDKQIAIKPDYGRLFDGKIFSKSLTDKLASIRNSTGSNDHYYISSMPGVGNPKFENENSYSRMTYPDVGYRILSLYRYWAMINYFFPYKDIIGTDWNKQLETSIPEFVNAKDAEAYVLATLKIISSINDTHANIWGDNKILFEFKGRNKLPFRADFIENKLVVTGYYGDTLNVKQKFRIGDVITEINGKPVEQLIKKFLPYTAASNYDTKLRDLPGNYLLRGNTNSFKIGINRAGKSLEETINGVTVSYYTKSVEHDKVAYKLLSDEIGYVFPGKYKNADLPDIKELFKNTKGIIVDMRTYPSDFMPFTFGQYIKSTSSPFVKFSHGQLSKPGLFVYSKALNNGSDTGDKYKGKVIVIVNATSQSQAEYTTMAFQSSPNVTVIGSTTAGADGNVSSIVLPGGIYTMISGIGIFYPDGKPTQRVGVKIDHVLKPTIKGTIEGRDELLEKAKEMLGDLSK